MIKFVFIDQKGTTTSQDEHLYNIVAFFNKVRYENAETSFEYDSNVPKMPV